MPLPRPPLLSRRALLRGAAAASVLACAGCTTRAAVPAPAVRAAGRLRLLAEQTLPHRLQFQGTTVGGLSGLDHDPASGTWVVLSDDRSELQPARFYTLRLALEQDSLAVELLQAVTLLQAAGTPFPKRQAGGEVVDPEGIRLLPGGRRLLWTSEGDWRAGASPGLREARIDGSHVRNFEVPSPLQFAARPGSGPRPNLTFEGLALSPDARTAWVAMEGALQQDGPEPGSSQGAAPCRFTAFDVASGRAVRQLAYLPDAIPRAPVLPATTGNGVSEILMVDPARMLVLERAFLLGTGMSLRLYEIDVHQASDTLGLPRLVAGSYRPAPKRLVADFAELGLSRLANTEGLCWGPRLANGGRTLVAVSDDNFSGRQVTQFAAFEYLEHQ